MNINHKLLIIALLGRANSNKFYIIARIAFAPQAPCLLMTIQDALFSFEVLYC